MADEAPRTLGEMAESRLEKKLPGRTLQRVGINVDSGKPVVRGGADNNYGLTGHDMDEALVARDVQGNFDIGDRKGRITHVHYGTPYGPDQLTFNEYLLYGEPPEIVELRSLVLPSHEAVS